MERRIVREPAGGPPGIDVLQVAAALAAVYLLVVGIVAFARAGFLSAGLTEPVVTVGVVNATPVFAVVIVLVGLVLLWAAVGVEIDDIAVRIVAGLTLVLGIVLLIEPGAFQGTLGTEASDGLHYLLLGAVLLVLTFVPPVAIGGSRPAPPAEGDAAPPRERSAGPGRDEPPNDGTTQRIR